jgi:hypothetical protein
MTPMTFCFPSAKRKPAVLQSVRLAAAISAVLMTADNQAAAARRHDHAVEAVESRAAGAPVMAIVSLRSQRVTVYDAAGWILRAPVSSGQTGRETPAGVFSVIQKEAEHYSNLYDDAFMPHMQRITWSGIALHGGPLPGYAASHGCIRMPYDFAERLFGETKVGMRVIVAPADVTPVEIAHPALFVSKPGARDAAAARAAEAKEAAGKAEQARRAAMTASRDAAEAARPVRLAELQKRKGEAELASAERRLVSAGSDEARQRADDDREKAASRVAEVEAQIATANAELQSKLDAAASARQTAADAETARVAAADAASKAARELEPVSVFISRKTQHLYVRQAFQPILDVPVTIQDADRPIGTHVFTAVEGIGNTPAMRWTVVSLASGVSDGRTANALNTARSGPARDIEPMPAGPGGAKAALDRITIPQDVLDRIAGMVSPRSSLIISDEALSPETGKGTDFIVIMSNEPQGGIKFRRHNAATSVRYERPREWPYYRAPGGYSQPSFPW